MPLTDCVALPNEASTCLENGILLPGTGAGIHPLNGCVGFKSQLPTRLRAAKPLKWRRFPQIQKPPLFVRTGWWWTQSSRIGLHPSSSRLIGKITGNFDAFGLCSDFDQLGCWRFQRVKAKFPSRRKRELFPTNRERGLC